LDLLVALLKADEPATAARPLLTSCTAHRKRDVLG
jgi:hypothetical protein